MRRQLAIVVALACAGLVAALLPAPVWLRALLLIPQVLFLPGYALAAGFFAPGTCSASERAVYSLTLSIAATAITGLVTQVFLDLSRDAWAVMLFAVTVGAAARALRFQPPARPLRQLPWALAPAIAAFAIAAAIAAFAIASASDGLREAQARIRFTGFWLLPGEGPEGDRAATAVSVGLRSHEGRATGYTLRLSRGGTPIATRALELRTGQEWERSFPTGQAPANIPVVATLSREGRPYRRLEVTPPR